MLWLCCAVLSCRLVFMASGMAVATLTNSAAAAGIAAQAPPLAMPSSDISNSGALLIASALLAMLGLASAGQQVRAQGPASCSVLQAARELQCPASGDQMQV
jgi:hypothetical protein